MNIRWKLQFVALVGGAIVTLTLGLVLTWTSAQVSQAIEQSLAIDEVVRGVFELSVVTNDYLLHHEDRARMQWELRHGSLEALLADLQSANPAEGEIVDRIMQSHARLTPLFSNLVANHERRDPDADSTVSEDQEQRLVGQILVAAQTMVTEAFQLARATGARVESTQRRGSLLVLVLGLPMLAFIVAVIVWVGNGVTARIRRLRRSTEIIAAGDLNYRMEEGSSDEIGDLARAFNEMTHRLKGSYESLQQEIVERKHAESERNAMEAQLRQQQKLESIGTLASGVAHEINNPLMGIISYAELIGDELADETLKGYAAGIIREGDRVATIVRNLLSFARQEKEAHSPADIRDIIDSSLSLVSAILRRDQITIDLDVPEDLPKVKCRTQRIQQVVINLLTNAHAALNERYPAYDEDKLLRITSRRRTADGREWVRTTIEDHGTGIPEELLERIFDPFYTTKPRDEGTGLGLSVSFGIIREHKGRLLVESELGSYTRFHIDLAVDNGWSHRGPDRDGT
jgi:signal transduction histidine kinase